MKENSGQLGLVRISKKAIKQGFRTEGGKLVKYDNGRKRNHWKTPYRKISRKHLKDKCENRRCSTIHRLTIHHIIPLSSAKSEEELVELCRKDNCKTLCQKCHQELEQRITLKRNGKHKKKKKVKKSKKAIVNEGKPLLVLEKGLWGEYRIIS